jgi:hypothetical protein
MSDPPILSADDEAERGAEPLLAYLRRKYGPGTTTDSAQGIRRISFALPDREVSLFLADALTEVPFGAGIRLLQAALMPCSSPGLAVTCTVTGTATVGFAFGFQTSATIDATLEAGVAALANLWDGINMLLEPPGVCMPDCRQVVVPGLPRVPVITVNATVELLGVIFLGSVTATQTLSASIWCV